MAVIFVIIIIANTLLCRWGTILSPNKNGNLRYIIVTIITNEFYIGYLLTSTGITLYNWIKYK